MRSPLWVGGVPVTQGSMIGRQLPGGRIAVVPQNPPALKRWRTLIRTLAGTAGLVPLDGAVCVQLHFVLERGSTVTRALPTVKPDVDKLARAVLDALTGVAYGDDGQVVELHVRKSYSADSPGVWIRVGGVLTEDTTPALFQEGTTP